MVAVKLLCILILFLSTVTGQCHRHHHRERYHNSRRYIDWLKLPELEPESKTSLKLPEWWTVLPLPVSGFNSRRFSMNRIINGAEVDIESHPYQVNMLICGGAIIGKKWIITAAHCGSRAAVFVGSANFQGGTRMNVLRRIQHPKYNRKHIDYDFALFELSEELNYSDSVKPIVLADKESDNKPGTMAMVTGWGVTETGEIPDVLHGVSVPLISTEECKKLYRKLKSVVTDRMLCAAFEEGGKDSCVMDSGGPLAADGKLVGVTSWGPTECGKAGSPGVYSKISSVRDWIKETTGI